MLQQLEQLAHMVATLLDPAAAVAPWQLTALIAIGIASAAIAMSTRAMGVLASIVLGIMPQPPVIEPAAAARMRSQSDPDAAGKPRPRAPASAVATAVR